MARRGFGHHSHHRRPPGHERDFVSWRQPLRLRHRRSDGRRGDGARWLGADDHLFYDDHYFHHDFNDYDVYDVYDRADSDHDNDSAAVDYHHIGPVKHDDEPVTVVDAACRSADDDDSLGSSRRVCIGRAFAGGSGYHHGCYRSHCRASGVAGTPDVLTSPLSRIGQFRA